MTAEAHSMTKDQTTAAEDVEFLDSETFRLPSLWAWHRKTDPGKYLQKEPNPEIKDVYVTFPSTGDCALLAKYEIITGFSPAEAEAQLARCLTGLYEWFPNVDRMNAASVASPESQDTLPPDTVIDAVLQARKGRLDTRGKGRLDSDLVFTMGRNDTLSIYMVGMSDQEAQFLRENEEKIKSFEEAGGQSPELEALRTAFEALN